MKQLIYKLLILFIGIQLIACKNSIKNSHISITIRDKRFRGKISYIRRDEKEKWFRRWLKKIE